ncbi:MAG: hypothetical protein IJT72_10290 [Lachnospiraceae bacterium]|nr:hypothetical protein [Lachnospiraceae bacterium]
MEIKEFIGNTVKNLDTKYYAYLKDKLLGEYLTFGFIEENKISKDVFCEKLMDYFEKVEIKVNYNFSKLLVKYVENLYEVVRNYIPKEPSVKKGEQIPPMSRSAKYYKHALEIKESRNFTMRQVEDYSRIMLSLYMGAVNAGQKEVNDFEFSTEGMNLDKIISALKAEKPGNKLPIGKKTLFNLEDLYSTDTVTFIITMIMFCHIKNREVRGE